MSVNAVSVKVTSSWQPDNQKCLKDAVTLTPLSAYKRNVEGSLTDMVELDSCILLTPPNEQNGNQDEIYQPCSITLQLEGCASNVISTIVVVCEARIIEVFGACNEYLTTVTSELLDEMDDSAVYCAEIGLTQMTSECTLKFARLRKSSEMWVYGIKVLWKTQVDQLKPIQATSSVNFETVEQRLKESKMPLSNKAESCRQFLKMYGSLSEERKGGLHGLTNPMALLSLLPATQLQGKSLQSTFSRVAPESLQTVASSSSPMMSHRENDLCSEYLQKEEANSCCTRCGQNFDRILGEKLQLMENRIMKVFDEKLSALQRHQDIFMENLVQNIFKNSALNDKVSTHVASHEASDQTVTPKDLKVETVFKQILNQDGEFTNCKESINGNSTLDDGKDQKMLRKALLAMQFNEMFVESPHPGVIEDRNGPTALKNVS